MNCSKCGSPITENDQFCKNCGATVNAQNNNVSGITQPQMDSQINVSPQPTVNAGLNSNPQSQIDNSINPNSQVTVNAGLNSNLQPQMVNDNVNSSNYSQPQQPINNQQPAWANGYNQTPNYSMQQKQSGNGKYVIIGLIIVVALVVIGIVVTSIINKDRGNSNISIEGNSTTNNSAINTKKSSYKVKFKNFTLSIPQDLVYENSNDELIISDEEGTWATILRLQKGSFAQLKSKKSQLQSLIQQTGYTSSAAVEKTIKGTEFITLEVSGDGQNEILAFAKANSMFFFTIDAMNLDNEFDYSLLEKISPIINSAEYSESANNIATNKGLNFSGLEELAK